MHEKIFNRKTIIIVSAIVTVIVLLLVFSNSLKDAVKEAVKPDESKLSQTYNASRYFFRVGYPDDWFVEDDVNGFGFKNNNDKGIVIRMFNADDAEQKSDITNPPLPTGTDNSVAEQLTEQTDYSTVINFFYRGLKEGEVVSGSDACQRFMDEFSSGLMYEDDYAVEYKFGNMSEFTADNLTFSFVEYTCKVYSYTTDASGQKVASSKPLKTLNGELYAASRSMAYYAVNFESELDPANSKYKDYRKDFINILNDFRFSVFAD